MKDKHVLIGIALLLVSILFIIYREYSYQKIDNRRISIHDITGSGAKSENIDVYLNASYIASNIASKKNDQKHSFYVIFGDDVQYIVYLSNEKAKEINNFLLDNPNSTYKIVGKTKLIPSKMEKYGKDFVRKWLDANHDHSDVEIDHSHEISNDEFYEYFGYVYLDTTVGKYSNFTILNYLIYIIGGVGLLFVLNKVYKNFVR